MGISVWKNSFLIEYIYWSDPFVPQQDVVARVFAWYTPVYRFESQAIGGHFCFYLIFVIYTTQNSL